VKEEISTADERASDLKQTNKFTIIPEGPLSFLAYFLKSLGAYQMRITNEQKVGLGGDIAYCKVFVSPTG
jgi:hypothetical protein